MILFIDEYPKSFLKKAITFCKIFVKEGFVQGDWQEVLKNRKVGGSVSMPEIVKWHLPNFIGISKMNVLDINGVNQIFVFKDVLALEWALKQKKKNPKLKIIAGPFIVNHPSERKFILENSGIDALVYFSQWHQDMFKFFSKKIQLKKNYNWFCGVDEDYWQNDKIKIKDKVLIYSKTNPEVSEAIKRKLENQGFEYLEIVCGEYTPDQYKLALSSAKLAIFVSVTETQGLAIFEAWSCNVPTLHFDPGVWSYQGIEYKKASSCPYLEPKLGGRFSGVSDFDCEFKSVLDNIEEFTPREIVLKNYTIAHSMKKLSQILSSD